LEYVSEAILSAPRHRDEHLVRAVSDMRDLPPWVCGLYEGLTNPERKFLTYEATLSLRTPASLAFMRAVPYPLSEDTAAVVAKIVERYVYPWPDLHLRYLTLWARGRLDPERTITELPAFREQPEVNYATYFPDPADLRDYRYGTDFTYGLSGIRDFDWRRIRDNVCLLRPETLEKLNQLVVGAGHVLVPKAIESVRGDTFVVETNIHYPTESGLIGDGLRKVVILATRLAAVHGQLGWRQHQHLLKSIKEIVRRIGRAARAKGLGADRLKPGYQELVDLAEDLMTRASQLLKTLACCVDADVIDWLGEGLESPEKELLHYLQLTRKVCGTAKRRVLLGETIPNEEKLFSIFEPHTELIKRGKQPDPIQYGHKVLVIEDAIGFICAYQVVANGGLDQELLVPAMTQLQKRMGGKIKRASFDRGFHTPDNQKKLAEIVAHPCIPKKGQNPGRKQQEEASVEFRQARQHHPGVESAIGALQAGNGQERCRDRSKRGYERYVGLGILGRNLHVLGKLLVIRDEAGCQAGMSKRKKQAG